MNGYGYPALSVPHAATFWIDETQFYWRPLQPICEIQEPYPSGVPGLSEALAEWFSHDPYADEAQMIKAAPDDLQPTSSPGAGQPLSGQYGNCLVCGLEANGIHYGRRTCEGCKSFFKRAVQTQTCDQFKCKEAAKCSVISSQRSYCRRCRWDKCVSAGLQIESVRRGTMAGRAGRPRRKTS
ncbi:unnamed protein product, partial [Mesorhabditis spiculigera]